MDVCVSMVVDGNAASITTVEFYVNTFVFFLLLMTEQNLNVLTSFVFYRIYICSLFAIRGRKLILHDDLCFVFSLSIEA